MAKKKRDKFIGSDELIKKFIGKRRWKKLDKDIKSSLIRLGKLQREIYREWKKKQGDCNRWEGTD